MSVVCKICGDCNCRSVMLEEHQIYVSKCRFCGNYLIDDSSLVAKNRLVIAGYLYEIGNAERTKEDDDYFLLDSTSLDRILTSPLVPQSITDKISKLLEYIAKHTNYFGEEVITPIQAGYLTGIDEMGNISIALSNLGLIYAPRMPDGVTNTLLRLQ